MRDLLLQFWPSWTSAITGAVTGGVLFVAARFPAVLWHQRGARVGDTRKIFHFIIFTGASLLRWQVDTGAVVACGLVVVSLIGYATWCGRKSLTFNTIARPSDAPHERLYVLSPMISTAVGGVVAQLIAGPLAVVSYLVAGWGDAIGEPVGIRWGRHRYRVPTWDSVPSERSLEGSAAVLIASVLAAELGLILCGQTGLQTVPFALAIGLAATAIEAFSPHGWDNFTLLAGVACVVRLLVAS